MADSDDVKTVVTDTGSEESAVVVDEAIDTILAAFKQIDSAIGKLEADNVPQQAAIDAAKDAYTNGVKPYFADFIVALDMLEER